MNGVWSLEFSERFWASMLDHVWQSTLFSLVVLLALVLLRNAPSKIRYALWISIPLKFVVPSSLLIQMVHGLGMDLSSTMLSMAWASGDPLAFVNGQNSAFHAGSCLVSDASSSSHILYTGLMAVWAAGTLMLSG